MAANQTTENNNSISAFLTTISDQLKRDDSYRIIELFELQSGFPAKMWGPAIIGFGTYHYKYESGREGNAPIIGFSPRKEAISLYLSSEFENRDELLSKFGKHKSGKSCIYIKKLGDINPEILKQMIDASIRHTTNEAGTYDKSC